MPFDINNDDTLDLIRVSRPWQVDGKSHPVLDPDYWPHYGHLQMLINNGKGVFSDKTAKYVKRWSIKLNAPYDFKFVDINKDGLTDIFYTSVGFWTKGGGSQRSTHANGFLVNTGSGFKNYGNTWFKKQTKRAITASKKLFDSAATSKSVGFALGNFDSVSDLEVASRYEISIRRFSYHQNKLGQTYLYRSALEISGLEFEGIGLLQRNTVNLNCVILNQLSLHHPSRWRICWKILLVDLIHCRPFDQPPLTGQLCGGI